MIVIVNTKFWISNNISNERKLVKVPISPTNQRFSKSPQNCDIIFFEDDAARNFRHDSVDYSAEIVLDICL